MKIKCYITNKLLKNFILNELSMWQMDFIAHHLRSCPKCMERHFKMIKIFKAKEKRRKKEELFEEISAQIDFEKLKNRSMALNLKYINNPHYEEEYRKINSFVELIENSLERSKNKTKINVVQEVMNKIN